jgi:hypothetical protein
MKILLQNFNAKVGTEDIFKPNNEDDCLHEISNSTGVREVKFIIQKNLNIKSTVFPYHNIHKYTLLMGKQQNQIDHILIDKMWHSNIIDIQSFR